MAINRFAKPEWQVEIELNAVVVGRVAAWMPICVSKASPWRAADRAR
jgi:hypothetical protein